jgi:hypothetical protein
MSELDHTMVSIRISGKDLDPKNVGELLSFKESEKTTTNIGYSKSGITHWSISLKSKKRLPLEDKIEALFSNFTDDDDIWKQVTEKLDADIFCGMFLDTYNEGLHLVRNY